MASNSSREYCKKATRLQDTIEKRLADEQLKQKEESKRQKQMFTQENVVGPRDIIVNSILPRIKLDVKQEPLDVEPPSPDAPSVTFVNLSLPKVKVEVGNCLVVKVEETLKLEEDTFTEQVISQLGSVEQTKNPISETDVEYKVALTEMEQDNNSLEQLEGQSFEKVLPFLYPELTLNDILACRKVCCCWQTVVDTFLDTHPSKVPFDKDTHLNEQRKLELGRIPSWSESPLYELANVYRFSGLQQLNNFTNERKGKIVGSAVCLDNINIHSNVSFNMMKSFFTTFGMNIKYLKIRQTIELPKFELLMNRVTLCLGQLPNLAGFTLGIYPRREDTLENETCKKVQSCVFPTFQLESLEIHVDSEIKNNYSATYLFRLYRLISSFSKQLKQLSISDFDICNIAYLDIFNLVQLTIPQSALNSLEAECENLEKCTITSYGPTLYSTLPRIQKLFPRLICLGFKMKYVGAEFHCSFRETSTLKLQNIQTLELENCRAVTFSVLNLFPNLRYLKLTNELVSKLFNRRFSLNIVLNVKKLCQGENLYKLQVFWEKFPGISMVTLEMYGKDMQNSKPTICTWTRIGYVRYWSSKIHQQLLKK